MEIRIADSLEQVSGAQWDALHSGDNPFLQHAFLAGLETCGCLEPQGWYPMHLLAYDGRTLIGALPLYARDNSYGEFVFDWGWAEAYERAGGRYYPKLVSAIPFTPASGERLLLDARREDGAIIAERLIDTAVRLTDQRGFSSFHCLFPNDAQIGAFAARGLLRRAGCQYHWFNRGYATFEDFLAGLNHKRRKQIRHERRAVASSGLGIELRTGADMDARLWSTFYEFYCSTFYRRWGAPRLTEAFFNHLSRVMPDATLVALARDGREYVAGAFAMRGRTTLYGRHWGCARAYPFLHFELCYYQTIDYCIREGLQCLDAGAQGEHKIARGFEAVATHSAHWIGDPGFRRAVKEFLARETRMVNLRIEAVAAHSPYRITDARVAEDLDV
jgi:hypothetical protein